MKTAPASTVHWLIVLLLLFIIGCGAALERSAMDELEEDGYSTITLQPSKSASRTFSFEAERNDQPCRGEIALRQEMGQTVSTVTSQCEPVSQR